MKPIYFSEIIWLNIMSYFHSSYKKPYHLDIIKEYIEDRKILGIKKNMVEYIYGSEFFEFSDLFLTEIEYNTIFNNYSYFNEDFNLNLMIGFMLLSKFDDNWKNIPIQIINRVKENTNNYFDIKIPLKLQLKYKKETIKTIFNNLNNSEFINDKNNCYYNWIHNNNLLKYSSNNLNKEFKIFNENNESQFLNDVKYILSLI